MVDYIVLAEFDIDKGSGVRIQYPETVPGTNAEQLAEYMITEGAHNFGVVSTYFSVAQRPNRELLSEMNRMLANPYNTFLEKIFTPEKKQRLLENFWIGGADIVQAKPELRYVTQKVQLYRIENMAQKPYFQQGKERLVEFQITSQNSTIFAIKLIADPADSTSPLIAQKQKSTNQSRLMGSSNQGQASNQHSFSIEIKVHPFLNFQAKESEPYRAQFENQQGYIYAIEIVNENVEERVNLYQMMQQGLGFDPYNCIEYTINQNQQTIYFSNLLKNRHDDKVKRGAIVKALAFGCKQKVLLEPLSQLLEATLDQIIDTTDLNAAKETNLATYSTIISQVHTQINQQIAKFLLNRGNYIERAVSLDYSTNCALETQGQVSQDGELQDALYQMKKVTMTHLAKTQIPVGIPLASPPDQVTTSSLIRFINYFGHQTMVIYDAILSDKRIIFAGSRNLSITQIQNYLFAASSMVSPPLFGIHNKIMPYVPLVNMSSLEGDEGFLAGVTNPMFLENRRCYDVSIQIDEGKLNADSSYKREPYFELDMEFIKTLLVRIRADKLNDDECRQAFQSYTQLMLDMATNLSYGNSPDSQGMTHQGKPLSQQYLNRTRRLKSTHLFKTHIAMQKMMDLDMTHSVSLANIKSHMRTLRIKGVPAGPLTDYEVNTIYKDIDAYLQDRSSALKLLYMMPACRQGVALIAHGLFYDDERVQYTTARILTKLKQSCKAGALAVNRLSEFFKMKLFDIQQEMEELSEPGNTSIATAASSMVNNR